MVGFAADRPFAGQTGIMGQDIMEGTAINKVLASFLIMWIAVSTAACGSAPATPDTPKEPAAAGADKSEAATLPDAAPGADEDEIPIPPHLKMIAQSYEGSNIIEVPQLSAEKASAALDSINGRILEFAGDYESYAASPSEAQWLELKCYPLLDEKYMQIILTRAAYPDYATYGDILSVCYDYQEDRELTLGEAAQADDLDFVSPENKLLGVLPENMELKSFEPAAFAISQLGSIYFYSVFLEAPAAGDDDLKDLYIRYPDGSYDLYDHNILPFGPLESGLLSLEPKLYYAQG